MSCTSLLTPFVLVLSLCYSSLSPGQSVIAAAGGESGTDKVRIEWTLGEFAIQTLSTPLGLLTEGYHQPRLQVTRMPAQAEVITEAIRQELKVTIAPNPVKDILNIKLQRKRDLLLHLRLLSANGVLLQQQKILAPNRLELDLSKYPGGLYLLQFIQKDGQAIETYKISKQ